MDFNSLIKFLHRLLGFVAFVLFLGFLYMTVVAWPDSPFFDPKVFWVVCILIFVGVFLFSFRKAWYLRPHLHFKSGRVRRPQTPEDKEMFERWKSIRHRAFFGSQDEMKQAILEADGIANKALENHGFDAPTTEEKILQILSDDLWRPRSAAQKANKYRNKIYENPEMEVERADVRRAIHNYEVLLNELDVVDPTQF